MIDHLREVAKGGDDIRTECAGTIAGAWFSTPIRRGEELVAAGLLMLAGYVILMNTCGYGSVGSAKRVNYSVWANSKRRISSRFT